MANYARINIFFSNQSGDGDRLELSWNGQPQIEYDCVRTATTPYEYEPGPDGSATANNFFNLLQFNLNRGEYNFDFTINYNVGRDYGEIVFDEYVNDTIIDNSSGFIDVNIIQEDTGGGSQPPEPDPLSIDVISVSEASTDTQTKVRYDFTVINPAYPFDITSPISKTINSSSDQWIEYDRYPNLPDAIRDNLTIYSISGTDSKELPLVELFDINEINVVPNTTGGTVEVVSEITYRGINQYDITPTLEYSIDNVNWQSADSGFISTFEDVLPGTYTAYVRDQYGRIVNQEFTVQEIEEIQLNIKFKIDGNSPPFDVELKTSGGTLIDTKTVQLADTTQIFQNVSAETEYCIFVTDSIGNTDEYCNIIYGQTYLLSLSNDPVSGGTITLNDGSGDEFDSTGGTFSFNKQITLTVVPDPSYKFDKWNDDNTDNPRNIVIQNDLSLIAQYIEKTYNINLASTYDSSSMTNNDFISVWGDGNYLYATSYEYGLSTFTYDGSGNLTLVDSLKQITHTSKEIIWGDGNYIYLSNSSSGIHSYSVDGSGIITYNDNFTLFNSFGVHGDGNYVYAISYDYGVSSYSVDGSGNFTSVDNLSLGVSPQCLWVDNGYIYVSSIVSDKLYVLSADAGGNLTLLSDINVNRIKDIWSDNNFIYTLSNNGLTTYSNDGNLTLIDSDSQQSYTYLSIWGDGNYVYVGCDNYLILYEVDGSGNLTYIDTITDNVDYEKIWVDGNDYAYIATDDSIKTFEVVFE